MGRTRRLVLPAVIVSWALVSGCGDDDEDTSADATVSVDVADLPTIETEMCDYATALEVCGGQLALDDAIDITKAGSEAANKLWKDYFEARPGQAASTYDNLLPLLDNTALSPGTRSWLGDFLRRLSTLATR